MESMKNAPRLPKSPERSLHFRCWVPWFSAIVKPTSGHSTRCWTCVDAPRPTQTQTATAHFTPAWPFVWGEQRRRRRGMWSMLLLYSLSLWVNDRAGGSPIQWNTITSITTNKYVQSHIHYMHSFTSGAKYWTQSSEIWANKTSMLSGTLSTRPATVTK